VIFTGSTEVAQHINRKLAERAASESHHGIEPCVLVAETGGQNAMIVDSSALPEQVVQDVIVSAFDSAGQRCSALRVLCLQEEIADRILTMLEGAMRQLNIGPTDRLSVDIGPVIDAQARQNLLRHIEEMRGRGKRIFQLSLPAGCAQGTFVAPAVIEIADMSELRQEVFGPVLHVLRYRRPQLPALLAAIDATGYGLTLGIHSRIDETIGFIASHARVGNIYVNRNMVGAVVGVQPFGGEGKSGTGPKAGGPHYLMRLQRDAVFTQPTVSAAAPVGAALAGLLEWAAAHGHARTVAAGERHAHVNPLGACLVLAGPTGERNTLSFAPRGLVFCRPVDTDSLLHQLAAVFATGNHAALDAEGAALAVDLPPSVLGAIRFVEHVRDGDIRLALAERTLAARLMEELAERCGPEDALVPVIATGAADEIPLWRLLAERALCVNTAAAGGNASLMSLRS
jgi:RHH-type proline utilization regulon transcriptional repressor/proline dehydrogenase/delta 1-pyrroline-5-carboxylate dehydrogenase